MRVTSTLPRAARSLHYLRSTRALIFLIRGRAAPFAGTLPYGERSPFSSIKHAPTVRHNLVSRARSALFIVAVAVVPMILAPRSEERRVGKECRLRGRRAGLKRQ